MFFEIVNGYGVLYTMVAVAAVGIISRLCLNGIYGGLLRDLRRKGAPRRKLVQQMKKNYESCCQRNGEGRGLKDPDSFLMASLYNYHFLGMTLEGWRRIAGQALFLCILLGSSAVLTGSYYGMSRDVLELYTVTGLVLAAGLMDTVCLGNIGRKQALLEAAALNYLNNRLPAEAWESRRQTEKEALISEFRERKTERKLEAEAEIQNLAKSLEQIAAEREKEGSDAPYKLTPAEGRLVGEIIEGFLG